MPWLGPPKSKGTAPQTAEFRVSQADGLRDAGRPVEAAEAYRLALELVPGRGDLWVQLGNMLKDSLQFGPAQQAYRQALALSDDADTHLQLGHVYKGAGDRAAAFLSYRRALALDPALPGAIQELAEAGDPKQQERRFLAQRGEGVAALLGISRAIDAMRKELDRLGRMLPDAAGMAAVPVGLWGLFRALFPVPPPPDVRAPAGAFHVVLPANGATLERLFAQIGAIQAQAWDRWILSVAGSDPERRRVVALAAANDPRVRWIDVPSGTDPAQAERQCLAEANDGPGWVLLLAPGAMLDRNALGWFAAAADWSAAAAFVADEETGQIGPDGIDYSAPVLRQVVDVDTLREANVYGLTVAVRRDALAAAAPAVPETGIDAARAALLSSLASGGLVGHVPYPLVWRAPEDAAREPAWGPAQPRRGTRPTVSSDRIAIIIPTRDNADDVRHLVDSLRQMAAEPRAFEVLVVDNGSAEPAMLALARMERDDGIRVLRRDGPFNWSALNNDAAGQPDGADPAPLLLFMNDDMRMLTPGWDTELRTLLARPDVGAVGARLLYPDDTIQHAGVLFGWKGSVIHDGLLEPGDAPGPADRWTVTRAVGAVTGAFLATRRDVFGALAGFDAAGLPVAYADIDYCLKVREAGMRVIWTPHVTLRHDESKTRGLDHTDAWRAARNTSERVVMEARWGSAIEIDPGVNPFWHPATVPFRLVSAPAPARVREHVVRTGSGMPWRVLRLGQRQGRS